jgi:hypothetical protein
MKFHLVLNDGSGTVSYELTSMDRFGLVDLINLDTGAVTTYEGMGEAMDDLRRDGWVVAA